MRISVFLFIILIISKGLNSQQAHPVDSLQKFSYFIFGAEGGYFNRPDGTIAHFVSGTCFFVKDSNRTFLVSAKHVLTPFNPVDSTLNPHFPNTLYVKMKSAKTDNDTLWSINVKEIKDTVSGSFDYKDPD